MNDIEPVKVHSYFDKRSRQYITCLVDTGDRPVGSPMRSLTKGSRNADMRALRGRLPKVRVELSKVINTFVGDDILRATLWRDIPLISESPEVVAVLQNTSRGELAREVWLYNGDLRDVEPSIIDQRQLAQEVV